MPAGDLSPLTFGVAVAGICLLGFLVRLGFVLSGDFPLHDGGLFFQMVRDLQHAHYALPATTTYNSGDIPFAYPPLSIYVAGLLDDATPLGLINIFRFLPLAASTAMIFAFFLLARAMLPSRVSVLAATFAFAMLPRTYLWMIMGGGLTRSFGLLFAILAIHSAHGLYTRGDRRYAVTMAIFASLAVVSHIEMAWFAAFSIGVLLVAFGRDRRSLAYSAAIGAAVVALTSPWWATVLAQHGTSPFIGASHSGETLTNPVISFIQYRFTSEPLFPVLAALALVGVLACLAQRRFLFPAWILVALVLDQRAFGTVAAVPLALLIGVALSDVLVPLTLGAIGSASRRAPAWLMPAAIAVAACYAILGALVAGPLLLTAMSHDERDSMQWASENTSPSSRFLIVTADRWFADRTSEWFPALTQRQSVVTTQGYEWSPNGTFAKRLDEYASLQKCASKDGDCIAAWSSNTGVGYDYLYIPKLAPHAFLTSDDDLECCAGLRAALRGDPRYTVAFDGPGATIFHFRG